MKIFHAVGRLLLAAAILITNLHVTPAQAANLADWQGYGSENISTDAAFWSTTPDNDWFENVLYLNGPSGSAQFVLNVSEIADAVDTGGLEVAFSVMADISDNPQSSQDAVVVLGFGPTSTSPTTTQTLERGMLPPGQYVSLESSRAVPAGTRYIFVNPRAMMEFTTASFQSFSLIISDPLPPSLSSTLSPAGWTNTDVQVTIQATDADSGVDAILTSDGTPVGTHGSYTFTATENGAWTFTARDRAGHTSAPFTATLSGIDRLAPAAPELSVATSAWSNVPVGFSLSEVTAAAGESPVTRQFRLAGGAWQTYAEPAAVSQEGSLLLEARSLDAAGNASGLVSATVLVDRTPPQLNIGVTPHPQPDGGAQVSAAPSDTITNVESSRYAAGEQDLAFFTGGGGSELGAGFSVNAGGLYTLFAQDEAGNTALQTIEVNTYPSLETIPDQSMAEDTSLSLTFDVDDLESDAADLTVTAVSDQPAWLPDPQITRDAGTVGLAFAPLSQASGTAAISVAVTDPGGLTTTGVFDVVVQPVNDPPTAGDDSDFTNEDTPLVIAVLDNDSDPELGALTVSEVSAPAHGAAEITGSGTTITYTPATDYTGSDQFTYTMQDPGGEADSAGVTVTVNAVNDTPLISPIDPVIIAEGSSAGPLSFTVTDPDHSSAEISLSASSSNTAVIPDANLSLDPLADGSSRITIQPLENAHTWNAAQNRHDPVIITLLASDGDQSGSLEIAVTITPVNDTPLVTSDGAEAAEDTPVTVNVLANDSDVESEALTVASVTQPSHGAAAVSGGGQSVTYTPAANYNGPDSFTYTARDASGATSSGVVTVTVTATNDAPAGVTDSISLNEDTLTPINVLANDVDVDLHDAGSAEALTLSEVSVPAHGTAEIAAGQVSYTPNPDYSGPDTFTYTFHDAAGVFASGTVNLTVRPVNDLPVFSDLLAEYPVEEDGSIEIGFNVSDVETVTQSLMLQVVSGNETVVPANWVSITGLGDDDPAVLLTLTPAANQNGDVVFTLRLGDGFEVRQAGFTLHVSAVNDAPHAAADHYTFPEDQTITLDLDNLVTNDSDIDHDPLRFDRITPDSLTAGSLTELDAAAHTYTYTPPANFDGAATFEYVMTDGTIEDTALVTLAAVPENDAPTLALDPANPTGADEDTAFSLAFTIHDWETSAAQLSVQAGSNNNDVVSPAGLAITCDGGACTLSVTPSANKNGAVGLTLSLSDGVHLVSQNLDLTINALQDPPAAVNDLYLVEENGVVLLAPLANDYDVDGEPISVSALDTTGTAGTLTDRLDGTYIYTAPAGFTGDDTFAYTITDEQATSTATGTVRVSGLNNPPNLTGVANRFINEDGATGPLAFRASDPDGDTLTVTAVSSNAALVPNDTDHLLLTDLTGGNYTVSVTPAANAAGSATITLSASDLGQTVTTQFSVTVYPINDAPTAQGDLVTTPEDQPVTFNPLDNDSDLETPAGLRIVQFTDPAHGLLSTIAGNLTYTPFGNYHGPDSFTYTIHDGESADEGTVTITVVSVNDAPVARANWVTLANSAGASVEIPVLNNDDTAADTGETLLVTRIVSGPSSGQAEIQTITNPDDSLTYTILYTRDTAPADSHDSFVYEIADDDGNPATPSLTASATVYIASSWSPSVSADDRWITLNEDAAPQSIALTLHDGYAPAGLTLALEGSAPTLGAASVPDPDGNLVSYTPNANAYGSETLTYRVTSKSATPATASAHIYLTIRPVNDPPSITPVADVTIDEDASTAIEDVTIADVDIASVDDLIFTAYAGNHDLVLDEGIVVTRAGGTIDLTVTPIGNRSGTSEITLLASDGMSQTTETFTLTVTPVNDPPTAAGISAMLNEDTSLTLTVLTANADIDGDSVGVSVETQPAHGAAAVNEDHTITYTPAANYAGPDSFTYALNDSLVSAQATVSLDVLPVNDAPEIRGLAYLHETLEDTPVALALTLYDVDNDQTELEIAFASDNSGLLPTSRLTLSGEAAERSLGLDPLLDQNGVAVVSVTLSDGASSDEESFQLIVAPVNDLPQAGPDSATTDEDTAVTINVVATDSDVEDATLSVASITTPAHGTVTNQRDGTITYRPAANYYGPDSFTYTLVDDNDGRADALVSVTVLAVNDPPNAAADARTIVEDTPITFSLLDNDGDVEDDPISLTGLGTPSKGDLLDNGGGSITYTPRADQTGADSFSYTLSDGALSATGAVTITITPVNDAPRLSSSVAEPWQLPEDPTTDLQKTFPIHIYDPETPADNLVIKVTSSNPAILPATSIQLLGSGMDKQLRLTPRPNTFGSLYLTVEATDGVLTTTEQFDVEVLSVNDLPTITSLNDQTTQEDTAAAVQSFTVADVETAPADLSVTAATSDGTLLPPARVTITQTGGGGRTVQVRPGDNRTGLGQVTLTVADADGGSAGRSFDVSVEAITDPPSAVADTASGSEDTPVTILPLINDLDPDLLSEGDELFIVSVAGAVHGLAEVAVDQKSITYTPNPNWNGPDSFTYTINDSNASPSSASIAVSIAAVNDAPLGVNNSFTQPEDSTRTFNLIDNDTDVDLSREGDNLTIVSVADVTHAAVAIAAGNKSVSVTPTHNYFGPVTFNYTLRDLAGITSTASVTVNVTAVNDAPTISDTTSQALTEDTPGSPVTFTVADVDNDPATLTVQAASSNTTILAVPAGVSLTTGSGERTFTLTPQGSRNTWNVASGTHTPLTLTLTVRDAASASASDSFTVTIDAVNDLPVGADDSTATAEDTALQVDVLANDDIDLLNEGDLALGVTAVGQPDFGTTSITPGGKRVTYTPPLDWTGLATFSYTAQDVANLPTTATARITVNAVNDAPVAANDSATTDEDTPLVIWPLGNDSDVDGDALSLVSTVSVDHGAVALAGNRLSLTYTPDAHWNGVDTFNYTLRDPAGLTASAEISVTVNAVPDSPTATPDTASGAEQTPLAIDVLANDLDPDLTHEGDDLTIQSVTGPTFGSVSIDLDHEGLVFTPPDDWNGTDSFTYTVVDDGGRTASTSVHVTIQAANDDPRAVDDAAATDEDSPRTISVLDNDEDVDLDPALNDPLTESLRVQSVAAPGHGTTALALGGTAVRYTPTANWNGTDRFTYVLVDQGGRTDEAEVTVTVAALNDAPAGAADNPAGPEDEPLTIDVLFNDHDADRDPDLNHPMEEALTVTEVTVPDVGSVVVDPGGASVTYTPPANYNGPAAFSYTLSDASEETAAALVSLQIFQVYDAPEPRDDSAATGEEAPLSIAVLANDQDLDLDPALNQDPDGDESLRVSAVGQPAHGQAEVNPDGLGVTYTPARDYIGADSFTYTVSDAGERSASANVAVTVGAEIGGALNDPPLGVADLLAADEDTPARLDVLANDLDPDLLYEGDELTVLTVSPAEHAQVELVEAGKALRFTPELNWNGETTFSYTFADKDGEESGAAVTVTVHPVNDAPTISAVEDQTLSEDTPSNALAFTVADVDDDPAALSVQAASSNALVLPASGAAIAALGGGARSLVLTPLPNQNTWNPTDSAHRPLTLTLTVSDGRLSAAESFAVTVQAANDPPVAAPDTAVMDEDGSLTITVLGNDIDPDQSREGDTLSVISLAGVENAEAVIVEGKRVKFTPSANWNGVETFTYTIRDQGGLTASAAVTVTVYNVEEPVVETPVPVGPLRMLTPTHGARYKDGQSVHVTWTAAAGAQVRYKLEFFDGQSWSVLSPSLSATSFEHRLEDTRLHTDAAVYRVRAFNPAGSQTASGETFIIDNRAPEKVVLTAQTADGRVYTSGAWTNQAVVLTASGGWDLTGLSLDLSTTSGGPAETVDQGLRVSQPGEYKLTVTAVDPLGNQAVVGELTVRIDTLPPQPPRLAAGNGFLLQFQDDPGLSGNRVLMLPDGTQVSATGPLDWTPAQPGVYSFVLIDEAGNRTGFTVTFDGRSLEIADPVVPRGEAEAEPKPGFEPAPQPVAEPAVESGSQTPAQSFWSREVNPLAASLVCGVSGFVGLLLIVVVAWPNVRMESLQTGSDGRARRRVRRKRAFTPRDRHLCLDLPQGESHQVCLSPWLTRSLHGGSLTLRRPSGAEVRAEISQNAKGEFKLNA